MANNKMLIRQRYKLGLSLSIPYALLLVMLLSMSTIHYRIAYDALKKTEMQGNLAMLRESSSSINREIQQLQETMVQISGSSMASRFLKSDDPLRAGDGYYLYELMKEIDAYTVSDRMVERLMICYERSEMLVSAQYGNRLEYFDTEGIYGIEGKDWWNQLFAQDYIMQTGPVYTNQHGESYLTVQHTFGYAPYNKAVVYAALRSNVLLDMLNRFFPTDTGGVTCIFDASGNLMARDEGLEDYFSQESCTELYSRMNDSGWTMIGNDYLLVYTRATELGWTYARLIPMTQVTSAIVPIWKSMILIMLVCIVLASGLVYRNVRGWYRDLERIVARIAKKPMKGNVHQFIGDQVSDIVDSHSVLVNMIGRQKPYLKKAALRRLFSGQLSDEYEARIMTEYVGISPGHHVFRAVVISADECRMEEENNVELITMQGKIENVLSEAGDVPYVAIDEYRFALLQSARTEDELEKQLEIIRRVLGESVLNPDGTPGYLVGVGNIVYRMGSIGKSYLEARDALQYAVRNGSVNSMRYADCPLDGATFCLRREDRQRLENAFMAGSAAAVEVIFDQYEQRFFGMNAADIGKTSYQMILNQLCFILMECGQDDVQLIERGVVIMSEIAEYKDGRRLWRMIREMWMETTGARKQTQSPWIKRIDQYIEENFNDADLSISSISQAFSLSESYLSQLYKKATGKSISEEIERIRVEYAKKLLEKSSLKINEVARCSGFVSDSTFSRSFQKMVGVRATEYRNSVRN